VDYTGAQMILKAIAASLLFLQTAGGSIGITVVDGTTGQAISGVRIDLTKVPVPPAPAPNGTPTSVITLGPPRTSSVTSDASGRYIFQNQELGSYLVRVFKEGYGDQTNNIGSNNTTAQVKLDEKETSRNLTFRLMPGAAINGRVTGRDGKPIGNMEVGLFASRYDLEGRQTYQQTAYANTNDRGEYRIFPVNPGQYYLSVGPPSRLNPGNLLLTPFNNPKNQYPRVFYPGTTDPGTASLISVPAGGDLSSMDFLLTELPTFRIRGHVADSATGKVPENVGISILPRESNISTNSSVSGNIIDPTDGSFVLQSIAPGRYIIRAQKALILRATAAPPGAAPVVAASIQPALTPPGVAVAEVEVTNRDVDGVMLSFAAPLRISGRLQMQNGSAVPTGTRANIVIRGSALVPAIGGTGTVRWNSDGTFVLECVNPGEYYGSITPIRTGNSPMMYVSSARAGEVDLMSHAMMVVGPQTDEIRITLGQNGGVISGAVNRTSADASDRVILVPNDHSRRNLYQTTTIATNGSFSFQAVPPGSYKMFALTGVEGTPWFDPAFLSAIESAGTAVNLTDSANVSVNLNLIRRP